MYEFKVYQDLGLCGLKLLCSYVCSKENYSEAKKEATEWALRSYPNRKLKLISIN